MKITLLILGVLLSLNLVKAQSSIMDYKIISDSTNIYKSVDDILKMEDFKGKVVYVDFWGTRCGPCLKEFEYIPELKKRFQNDSVEFLYLCSPYSLGWDKDNEKRWKDLIVKHKLTGTNILISAECYMAGFFEKYKDKVANMYIIPTYLLVDKQGKITDFNALRPSSKDLLYNKIQLLLDEK